LQDHPLRVGLSVDVSVDVSDTSGSMAALPAKEIVRGDAGNDGGARTEALIQRILKQNGA
jgi:membrane fusion protein (multidrug efflux system)